MDEIHPPPKPDSVTVAEVAKRKRARGYRTRARPDVLPLDIRCKRSAKGLAGVLVSCSVLALLVLGLGQPFDSLLVAAGITFGTFLLLYLAAAATLNQNVVRLNGRTLRARSHPLPEPWRLGRANLRTPEIAEVHSSEAPEEARYWVELTLQNGAQSRLIPLESVEEAEYVTWVINDWLWRHRSAARHDSGAPPP